MADPVVAPAPTSAAPGAPAPAAAPAAKPAGEGGATATSAVDPGTSTKGADDKTGAAGAPPPPSDAPAEIELKLPEGYQANAEALGEFKSWAKGLGLKSGDAQKVFDLYVQQEGALAKAAQQHFQEQAAAERKGWQEALPKDKEFGGPKYEESRAFAQSAMKRFASPELIKTANEKGWGDNPEFFRMMVRVGQQIAEDRTGVDGVNGTGEPSKEAFLKAAFPNSPTMFKGS